jgi:hypothetical protein
LWPPVHVHDAEIFPPIVKDPLDRVGGRKVTHHNVAAVLRRSGVTGVVLIAVYRGLLMRGVYPLWMPSIISKDFLLSGAIRSKDIWRSSSKCRL